MGSNCCRVYWKVSTDKGALLGKGAFNKADYPVSNCLPVGTINLPLHTLLSATRVAVEVGVSGTPYRNSWSCWVYPAAPVAAPNGLIVTDSYRTAIDALQNGATVLLSPGLKSLTGVEGRFVPVFWSPVHFPDQPGTMGQLIKADHPALRQFPTADHTDWQWWDLVKRSKSLPVDSLPDEAILVRVIDNFVTNRNLANLFEVQVGKGKLLFSGIDLLTDQVNRPVARQLYNTLVTYLQSKDFDPKTKVSAEWIWQLIKE
ncbi:hypothetical protein [Paraflavitalea pollutisoli]|uniref:hypothetical protein n=1 Tax=Paraflavitalea pollutisoli TaxID=3034143 RepID=UPI0023EB8294|nr:hypothetical protein [Paraflavitalea sp. H1-2-19X]